MTGRDRFAPDDMGSLRGLCQLRTRDLLQITGAAHRGNGAFAQPWFTAPPLQCSGRGGGVL